jgi:hypothetical protein
MSGNNKPFPFRFATSPLPYEDCSDWKPIPALKGISRLTAAELEQAWGGTAQGMTAVATTGATTNDGGRPDTAGGDTHYIMDNW